MRTQRIPVPCSKKRVTAVLGALALICIVGCSSASGTPRVDSATPRHVAAGQSAFLIVEGAGFNRGASARVGSSALSRVTWVNGRVLTAELPAGLAPGSYDLSVSNPGGGQTTLVQALVVEGSPPPAQARPATAPPVAATKVPAPTETRTSLSPTPTPVPALSPGSTPEPARTATPARNATLPPAATATRQVTVPPTQQPAPRPTSPPAQPRQQATPNLAGQWTIVDTVSYGPGVGSQYPFGVVIQQSGTQITGSGSGLQFVGTISGNAVHVDYQQDNGATGSFDWTVSADGNSLAGSFTNSTGNGGDSTGVRGGSGTLVLLQPATNPPSASRGKQKAKDR